MNTELFHLASKSLPLPVPRLFQCTDVELDLFVVADVVVAAVAQTVVVLVVVAAAALHTNRVHAVEYQV